MGDGNSRALHRRSGYFNAWIVDRNLPVVKQVGATLLDALLKHTVSRNHRGMKLSPRLEMGDFITRGTQSNRLIRRLDLLEASPNAEAILIMNVLLKRPRTD